MRKRTLTVAVSVVVVLSPVVLVHALPCFPGAEGWGTDTLGGPLQSFRASWHGLLLASTAFNDEDNEDGSATCAGSVTSHDNLASPHVTATVSDGQGRSIVVQPCPVNESS